MMKGVTLAVLLLLASAAICPRARRTRPAG